MTTPAEQKTRQRFKKSIFANLVIASIMIGFALASTYFDFDSLAERSVMAIAIVIASLFAGALLIKWLRGLDEYEAQINARASMIALYSSLVYLPLQYLSEINLIPEIHITFLFMSLWFVYLIVIIIHNIKK